jgi:hypothetical protein
MLCFLMCPVVVELFFHLPYFFSCFGSVRLFTFQFCAFSSRFKSAHLSLTFQNYLPILYSSVFKSIRMPLLIGLYANKSVPSCELFQSVLKKLPIFRDFYLEPIFTLEKIATFCIFEKSRLLLKIADFYQKVSGHKEPAGIRAYFFWSFVFFCLCGWKEKGLWSSSITVEAT